MVYVDAHALCQNMDRDDVLLDKFLETFSDARKKTESPEYLNWKDIKYKSWVPDFEELKKTIPNKL